MHIKGEDLFETIKLFDNSDIHIIGPELSKISEIMFECGEDRRIKINFRDGSHERTGYFTEDDEFKIDQILSSWGV
ncbi:hypothetical protein MUP59_01935 [Candidatus Bathyarchaeota archaeon]|nr:hypothetical protein [Candidatus Bathyarchaeota archaeon]